MSRFNIPWFGISMGLLAAGFIGFCGYLIVDEIHEDNDFRARCEAQGGIVITQDADGVRVCVTVDDAQRKVIVSIER